MTGSGTDMFARYAYPPNELGYCGPADASVLLRRGAQAELDIARHARQFEGAWAYLQMIAAASRVADPLDQQVVEAYWIGNELLDLLAPEDVPLRLRAVLPDQLGASWMPGRADHGYQVFAVYPWVGVLSQANAAAPALNILDQCRIRWGTVIALAGERVRVAVRPLRHDAGGDLTLGEPTEQTAALPYPAIHPSHASEAPGTAEQIRIGAVVAMHWDWVCGVLSDDQARTLERNTVGHLESASAVMAGRSR